MGGRTIAKVRQFDLGESTLIRFRPHIVFLQIGTHDLAQRGMSPLTMGSAKDVFVRLHDKYGVRLLWEGQTIRRHLVWNFNDKVRLLTQYLKTVLERLPFAIYWTHRGFWRASSSYLSVSRLFVFLYSPFTDHEFLLTANAWGVRAYLRECPSLISVRVFDVILRHSLPVSMSVT